MKVTVDQVLAFRLERQFLVASGASPLDVVRGLAGVQAQVPSSAEAAVACRVAGGVSPLLDPLLADGRAIRTWAMRGTLHVLASDDAPAYLALLAATRNWEKPAWQRTFIATEQLASLRSIVAEALADGPKSREQLVAAVEASGDTSLADHMRSGWGMVLKPLAWTGDLCNAPSEGSRVLFGRPSDVVPSWPGLPSPDDAAPVVLRRYLAAHGPATEDDILGWLARGATRMSDLRRWIASLGSELAEVDVEGTAAIARAEDLDSLAAAGPSTLVRLLPAFDQWVLGTGTGNPWIVESARRPAVSRAGGWISPLVLAGGRVAGTWALDGATVAVALFEERAAGVDREQLAAEASRWGSGGGLRVTTV